MIIRCASRRAFFVVIAFAIVLLSHSTEIPAEELKYHRDVRPILSTHCFSCHGPDNQARRGGFRLDQKDSATAKAESGIVPIVPGSVDQSELIKRIDATDPDIAMPPASAHKPLSDKQRQILRRWIAQGAIYEPHWALIPPRETPLPAVTQTNWPRSAIDLWILARLEQEGLNPSPPADFSSLIRRLSFDLTGLPPTFDETQAFTKEMKAARELDRKESNTRVEHEDAVYLRWVDHFLSSPHYGERMAIDWLDAARFADTNGYQVDRDRDMFAYRDWVIRAFNQNMPYDQFTIEQIAGDLLPNPTLAQRIATGFHRNHMMNEEGGIIPEEFLAEYCADRVETTATVWLGQTMNCTRCHDHKFDTLTQRDYYGLFAFFHQVNEQGVGNYGAHFRRNAPPYLALPAPELESQLAELKPQWNAAQQELNQYDERRIDDQPEWEARLLNQTVPSDAAVVEAANKVPEEIQSLLKKPIGDRSAEEKKKVLEYQQSTDEQRKGLSEKLKELKKRLDDTEKQIPTTLVMEDRTEPRETRILIRGEYNHPGELVTASTPACLPPMKDHLPKNRMGLARWLVDPENPLPSRVMTNRMWQSVFGTGLVATPQDFGVQGESPSHPELLDWLSIELIRNGWNIKQMMKLIVTSSTYRQSSIVSQHHISVDPTNRLLARGPRFRLQAEFLRDQALAVSGLLSRNIGGPSVKPYHPAGLYEQVTAGSGTDKYIEGTGDDLFRRSLYSYWKRSVPQPAMLVFDAPFRESCTLTRSRTNTPLQALNLMNDPTYVEAARFLAVRILKEVSSDLNAQLAYGVELILARSASSRELEVLRRAYNRSFLDFTADRDAATDLLKVGTRAVPENLDPIQLAAMSMVATTILNLDEAVMKE